MREKERKQLLILALSSHASNPILVVIDIEKSVDKREEEANGVDDLLGKEKERSEVVHVVE